jgi:hypothetical protein
MLGIQLFSKCLQTDMASYMDITHKQLKHQITNSILTFNINKLLIVDVLHIGYVSLSFDCKINCTIITQLFISGIHVDIRH